MRNRTQILLVLLCVLAPYSIWAASPCDGVDRSLTADRKIALASAIAKQLQASRVDVLESFRLDSWSIIYVGTDNSDNAFLFYSGDPLVDHFVTLWGGAATENEQNSIRRWALKHAPQIPMGLANCFAWHVTRDREQ